MEVAVEYVRWLDEEIMRINRSHLYDLVLYENGKKLELPEKLLDSFAYTGLSNKDFITSNYYKQEVI